jgi:hypothetical protein
MAFAALIAGLVGAVALIAYFELRHWALAALVAVAPLCVPAASVIAPAFNRAILPGAPAAYPFGAAVVLLLGTRIVREVCDGVAPRAAVRHAFAREGTAVALAVAALLLAMLAGAALDPGWRAEYEVSALFFAAMLAVVFAASWLSRWFPYSEGFIARANLARERRERLFDRLAPVAETRWALSATGIALLFVVLAVFALRDRHLLWGLNAVASASVAAVLAFVAFLAAARDWRLAAAGTLAFAAQATLVFWSVARGAPSYSTVDFLETFGLLTIAAAPFGAVAASLGRFLREGDALASAIARTLREPGGAVTASALVAALLGLTFTLSRWFLSPVLVVSIATPAVVLLVFPALATVVYRLLPRYVSIDEALGKR